MSARSIFKLNRTISIRPVTVQVGDVLQDLTGRTVLAVLENGAQSIELAVGSGITLGPSLGKFSLSVSSGNLATIGITEPGQVKLSLHVINSDNSVLMFGSGIIEVVR